MKSRTYLWIARSIWKCENCHIFWMKSFASSKLCRVSLWELVSWASRERGFVIQIFFKSLTGNFLLRAIPYSATCHHLRRATNAWRYWSSSRSSPFITSSWTRRLYRRLVGEGAGIIILIDSRPTSFRHLPWTNHLAPIFLRLKI